MPSYVFQAGNVVTGEMVEELILSGADIIKVREPVHARYYLSKMWSAHHVIIFNPYTVLVTAYISATCLTSTHFGTSIVSSITRNSEVQVGD